MLHKSHFLPDSILVPVHKQFLLPLAVSTYGKFDTNQQPVSKMPNVMLPRLRTAIKTVIAEKRNKNIDNNKITK